MILVGSGFTGSRGTQPPDLGTPWFWASAMDTMSIPTVADRITVLSDLIRGPPLILSTFAVCGRASRAARRRAPRARVEIPGRGEGERITRGAGGQGAGHLTGPS